MNYVLNTAFGVLQLGRLRLVKTKLALTAGEIADHCAVHSRTVASWIEFGMLRSYRLPGCDDKRIKVEDFLEFVTEQELPVPQEFAKPQPRRVLIVDNEPRMARSIRRVVLRAGFQTQIASDGFRAGALLKTFKPGIVTLDQQMPGLRETDVLSYICASSGSEKIKLLVLSAMGPAEVERAIDAGADGVLQKPFGNDELLEQIERLAAPPALRTRTRRSAMAR